jgi:putative GTP pyrophosphokinase
MLSKENWDKKEQELKQQFDGLTEDLKRWGGAVDELIIQILIESGFSESNIKIPPKFRLKGIGSFISKALYRDKSGKYVNPIVDIEDKVATRLVVLTTGQIEQVQEILCKSQHWHANLDKNISNDIELDPTVFSYQAAHIIVRQRGIGPSEAEEILNPVACEIQVKTLFQHAYSEMSHSTVYKGPYRQDTDLLRKLARSMALMEAVDGYFLDMQSSIDTGRSLPIALSKEMNMRFGQLWPDFDKNSVDTNLSISIFNNLYQDGILNVFQLDEFITRYANSLQRIIKRDKYYLSHQPVLIFIAYMMKTQKRLLERKWDLDQGILDEIANEFGVSRDEYEG